MMNEPTGLDKRELDRWIEREDEEGEIPDHLGEDAGDACLCEQGNPLGCGICSLTERAAAAVRQERDAEAARKRKDEGDLWIRRQQQLHRELSYLGVDLLLDQVPGEDGGKVVVDGLILGFAPQSWDLSLWRECPKCVRLAPQALSDPFDAASGLLALGLALAEPPLLCRECAVRFRDEQEPDCRPAPRENPATYGEQLSRIIREIVREETRGAEWE